MTGSHIGKPNILLFLLDQLSFRALSSYGNKDSKTPNIDRLGASGIVIDSVYCPYPLCQPSRAAIWTGQYSHRNRVWSNGRNWDIERIDSSFPALGEEFQKGGYKTVHFGKMHDGGALRGFECASEELTKIPDENSQFPFNMDTYQDEKTITDAKHFLENYSDKKPLFMVVDLVNPHNICGWIGINKDKHPGRSVSNLPELLENFEFDDIENRPKPVQYLCCSHVRQSQVSKWDKDDFRAYLAAYYYYLERADRQIGEVLDLYEKQGFGNNSLFVVTADHGDNMGSRRSVTKQVTFYEEVVRVPLIFSGKGVVKRDKVLKGLVSSLDLFPTLLSYSGLSIPQKIDGIDLSKSFSTGKIPGRDYVTSEWFTEWGYTISPGRMIRSGNLKYIRYLEEDGEELYDLSKDPYEKKNVSGNGRYQKELLHMRSLFDKVIKETDDPFYSLTVKADKKWRSHEVGYDKHIGISAPEEKK